jgi:acyl-CoA hydrolase
MQPKSVTESQALLAHWMGPSDANGSGNIHGGTILKLIDEVAGVAALKHCRRRIVTVGMDRVTFIVPLFVGEIVTFKASVNAAWHSSMEIGIRVEAENPVTGEIRHSNTAYATFVALDDDNRPTPVPPLRAETTHQERRMREAQIRRSNRLAEREAILARRASEDPPTPPASGGGTA